MKFSVKREKLLKPIQLSGGVVEKKQTLPILSNILLDVSHDTLSITATDLEVEINIQTNIENTEPGRITVPARKFSDICRALTDESLIDFSLDKERAMIKSGRSRFVLTTLPADEFPNIESIADAVSFEIPQKIFKKLIDQTHFAMAQQDVRFYLNGLLFEVGSDVLRTVATDGHRLALCEQPAEINIKYNQQVIIPRKAVLELLRLLNDSDEPVKIQIGSNHIRVETDEICFTSKLIDGRFPDYQRVVPQGGDKVVLADRATLHQAVTRASILSNERYRSIRIQLSSGILRVLANNPEHEEAEEEVLVEYSGGQLEIGFNANYLIDAINAVKDQEVKITFSDANSCCLVENSNDNSCKYVVMPMRI